MLIEPNRDAGESSGYGRRAWQRSRDIFAAVALTLAALVLLAVTFVGSRSPAPQPVASSAEIKRN